MIKNQLLGNIKSMLQNINLWYFPQKTL
jgi:hypothetical protein